jgi:hypothetical protein
MNNLIRTAKALAFGAAIVTYKDRIKEAVVPPPPKEEVASFCDCLGWEDQGVQFKTGQCESTCVCDSSVINWAMYSTLEKGYIGKEKLKEHLLKKSPKPAHIKE